MNATQYLDYVGDNRAQGYLLRAASQQRGVFVPTAYMEIVGGNAYAALLLAQVVYWFELNKDDMRPRARYERDGHLWVVKTYEEWREELKFNSTRTVEEAFKRLCELKLIYKERHKSTFHDGRTVMHVRLDWTALMDRLKDLTSDQHTYNVERSTPQHTYYVDPERTYNVDPISESTSETTKPPISPTPDEADVEQEPETPVEHLIEGVINAFGYDHATLTRPKKLEIGETALQLHKAGATRDDIPAYYKWLMNVHSASWSHKPGVAKFAKWWPDYAKQRQTRAAARVIEPIRTQADVTLTDEDRAEIARIRAQALAQLNGEPAA